MENTDDTYILDYYKIFYLKQWTMILKHKTDKTNF